MNFFKLYSLSGITRGITATWKCGNFDAKFVYSRLAAEIFFVFWLLFIAGEELYLTSYK